MLKSLDVFYIFQSIDEAEFAHVVPPPHCGKSALCPLSVKKKPRDIKIITFEFQKIKYTFNKDSNSFEELSFPVGRPVCYYLSTSGYDDQKTDSVSFTI